MYQLFHRLSVCLLLLLSIFGGISAAADIDRGQYWEYTFRPGDSLWKIAKKYTNSANNWREIQHINQIHLGNQRRISPGTRIIIPVAMLKNAPSPARVIALHGDAIVQRASGRNIKAKIDTLLFSGDRVITANGQSLRLQFADHSELQIFANSNVVLDKLSYHKQNGMVDTRIRLQSGRVNSAVKKLHKGSQYRIFTPAATTAVRGTRFRQVFRDHISRTEVTEGKVGVKSGDRSRLVPAGFGLVAEQGKPLAEPVKLLPAPQIFTPQIRQQSVVIRWQALDGAKRYRYQLALDEKFSRLQLDATSTQAQIQLSPLASGHYYLRLRAADSNNLEGKNALVTFDIAPTRAPADADISTPINTLILTL